METFCPKRFIFSPEEPEQREIGRSYSFEVVDFAFHSPEHCFSLFKTLLQRLKFILHLTKFQACVHTLPLPDILWYLTLHFSASLYLSLVINLEKTSPLPQRWFQVVISRNSGALLAQSSHGSCGTAVTTELLAPGAWDVASDFHKEVRAEI